MSLSKQEESALIQVYDSYWHSYATGDIPTLASFLAEDYTQIGSVETEVFDNKKDAVHFIETTIDQVAGKVDMRNRVKKIEPVDPFVLITEQTDLYILTEGEWIFYAKFRASSFLKKIEGQWKFIHQHSSMPDIRADEGENIATEKISRENIELRDAIKRRTIELEQKNQELAMEAALERVRSRTMGMQKSEELKEVIQVVNDQFVNLHINVEHAGFLMDYKEREDMHIWLADPHKVPSELNIPYFDSPHWNSFIEAKEKGLDFFANQLDYEEKNRFYNDLLKLFPVPDEAREYYLTCPGLAISTVLLDNIGLYIENFSGIPYTDEENTMLMRFGKVFEQAYIRFNDLKQAETQAREAQIEVSLERVRSRSMAMHKSDELLEAGEIIFIEMQKLGIESLTAGIVIIDKEEKNGLNYAPSPLTKKIMPLPIIIPHNETIHMQRVVENWKKGNSFFIVELDEDETIKHQTFIAERSTNFPLNAAELIAISPSKLFLHNFYFKEGYILIVGGAKLSGEQTDIMLRFAKVFQQTYTRFLDLLKAEAQAREAQIEASLERVRTQAMAMQKSADLLNISKVLYEELKILGIDEIRNAMLLIHDEKNDFFLDYDYSSIGGKITQIPTNGISLIEKYVKELKENEKSKVSFLELKVSGEELESWKKARKATGQLDDPRLDSMEALYYYHYSIGKGNISISTFSTLSNEKLQVLERFRNVFQLPYQRYHDIEIAVAQTEQARLNLIQIQTEKKRAEDALTILKATQTQLIQSEKLASLGELTAGIAHEIQNPLNFVNNFSELSSELITEMNQEIEKGNIDEVKAIASDIKQNLEKINHHGKRADSIVKGMLQHSQKGSGQKEPTDLNAMAEEYLRLSYHGCLAKDITLNASFVTDLDKSIGNVNLVQQDISRVLLNLYNNAFYVVAERQKKETGEYEPTVTVTTKRKGECIEISVKDNGNGIPESIKDKIFQPFFTTKPTGQGTGLGLSLSYDIVKAHGGELRMETKEGEGSEFVIQLPIV